MRHTLSYYAMASVLTLILAACGGGGGSLGIDREEDTPAGDDRIAWLVNQAAVRSLVGGETPDFSSRDVGQDVDRLMTAANSLLASDLLVFVNYSDPVRGDSRCSGAECSSGIVAALLTLSASEVDFRDPAVDYQPVASHRGVSLAQGRGKTQIAGESVDYRGYGGWLQHSFFITETDRITGGALEGTPLVYSYSVGDAPNTNPAADGGSGIWRGVMVGADVSQTVTRGHPIQGDAEITIADFADPQASIAFTSIYDLEARTPRDDMTWSDIPVTEGGFATGSDEDSIEGRFYGPNHEEVGGIFEREGILGAFGAMRSDMNGG